MQKLIREENTFTLFAQRAYFKNEIKDSLLTAQNIQAIYEIADASISRWDTVGFTNEEFTKANDLVMEIVADMEVHGVPESYFAEELKNVQSLRVNA